MKTKKLNKKILAVLMSMMMCMSGFQVTAFADVPADAPASVSSEAESTDISSADTGSGSNSDSNTGGADIGGSGTGSESGAQAESSASGSGTVSNDTAAGNSQTTVSSQNSFVSSGNNIVIVDGNGNVTINNNTPESNTTDPESGEDSKTEGDSNAGSGDGTGEAGGNADADSSTGSENGINAEGGNQDADNNAGSANGTGEENGNADADSSTGSENGTNAEGGNQDADNNAGSANGAGEENGSTDADSNAGSENETGSESSISAEEAQANVEAIKIEVEQAEAAQATAKGEADNAAADVAAAGADVDKISAELTAAEEAVSNAASEEEAAQAVAKLEEVKAALSQAEAKLADAKAKAESADAALAAAIEAFNQAQAKLARAEEDAKNAANQGAGNSIGGGGGAGGGIADSDKEQGDAADKDAEKPEEEKPEEKPDLETDEAARLQAFIDEAAQLPETVTEENYEAVEAQLQNLLAIFGELTEEQQISDEIMTAYTQALALWEQLEGVKAMLLNEEGVAKIGNKSYDSFFEAMKALKDGETITLLEDVNSDGMYMVSAAKDLVSVATQVANNIIVDLNGHMIIATGNATKYGAGYGIFRAKGAGYTLTITNSSEAVGIVKGKVINSTASTLNITGPGKIDIQGEYTNRTIGSYGDININAPIDKLTITENTGTVIVGKNASVKELTVNSVEAQSGDEFNTTLIVNGSVEKLTVKQLTPNPNRKGASNNNTLNINASVGTLKLTQGISAMNPSKAGSSNVAYINAPIGHMEVTQTGMASQLYMNSGIGELTMTRSEGGGYSKIENDFPLTVAGSEFHVGTLNATINQVNFANPNNVTDYSNPKISVPDIVLIEGMDGHEITAGQMDNSTWKASNGTPKFEYEGVDYKYLTTVCVYAGKIVLHKAVLSGDVAGAVYLDGVNGNDDNDGTTPKTAVKTISAAQNKVGEGNLATIIVVNTVTVSDTENWDLGVTIQDEITGETNVSGILKRFDTFTGAMVNVANGGVLTLKNIIFDGGSQEEVKRTASAPLVSVQSDGVLNINKGTVLCNNSNTGDARNGGAINNKGSLNITDGLIQGNSTVGFGGAIYNTGIITMFGGEISKNHASAWSGASQIAASGGGICIGKNGSMIMSGGRIVSNSAIGKMAHGGGIALGEEASCPNSHLIMTGGIIEGNLVSGNGGGISVWTGGEAELSGGYITGNTCNDNIGNKYHNYVKTYFGGGGVYINTGAKVTMKTVEVTRNKSPFGGNGIAACPTTDLMQLNVKNGGVFYGQGADIYATASIQFNGGVRVPMSITNYTLNGYKYNWRYGGNIVGADKLNQVLRQGKENMTSISLTSSLTDKQGQAASEYCDLHITGNTSVYSSLGGGIGCNGTLIIGEDSGNLALEKKVDNTIEEVPDKEFDFTINFKTDDGNAYTGSITLWRDGKSETYTLDSEGNAKVTLTKDEYVLLQDLPLGVKYTITESKNNADEINIKHTIVTDLENLDSYTNPTITVNGNSNGTVVKGSDEVIFTNVYNTIGLKVKKIVAGENPDKDKAFAFEIKLVDKDGNPYNRTDSTEDESDFMGVLDISYEIFSDENTESLESGTLSFDENSAAKFELKHNQFIVFNKMPAGITALITELNESRVGYWTMIDHNGESMMTNTIGVQTGAGTDQSVVFTNTPIEPDEAALVVTKNISGDKPDKDASFKFNMALANGSNTDGVVMPENCSATVKGAGVTGFDIIKFTRAGKFQFVITEDDSEKEIGYEYDNTIWKVDVEVADKEDHLEVISVKYNSFKEDGITPKDSSYVDDEAMMVDQENDIDPDMMVTPETGAVFVNKYTSPKPTAFEIPVEKKVVVNGDNVDSNTINQTFNFTLADNNAADMLGYKLPEKTVLEITGEGSNKFRAIEFTKAGNYSFAVKETAGTAENWTYDNSEWIVDVKVDLNKDNSLSVSEINYKKNGETVDNAAEGSTIIFTNTYDKPKEPEKPTPTPSTGSLTITKTVQGGGSAAANKVYTFTVTGPEGYSENVTITGSGSETLDGLKAGTYTVTEDSDSAAISGYRWNVTVSGEGVTVNGASASVTVNEGENAKAAAVTFTNNYRRPPTDPEDPTPQNPPEDPSNPPEESPTDVPDPDVPLVNIPEEEPPLTEIPEEEPPLANIPEEEPPLVNIPEEEPPLSEIPEEEPPLAEMPPVEILDGDVPKTGDTNSALLWLVMSLMALFGMGTVLIESCVRRRRK